MLYDAIFFLFTVFLFHNGTPGRLAAALAAADGDPGYKQTNKH